MSHSCCRSQEITEHSCEGNEVTTSHFSTSDPLFIASEEQLSRPAAPSHEAAEENPVGPNNLPGERRSITGKIDEVGLRLRKYKPKIAAFTESWLDASTPDEPVSFADYLTFRKDRDRHSGGIICYVPQESIPLPTSPEFSLAWTFLPSVPATLNSFPSFYLSFS